MNFTTFQQTELTRQWRAGRSFRVRDADRKVQKHTAWAFHVHVSTFKCEDVCMHVNRRPGCWFTQSNPYCAQGPRGQLLDPKWLVHMGRTQVSPCVWSLYVSNLFRIILTLYPHPVTSLPSFLLFLLHLFPPPPLYVRRWSCGWSDPWIKSSASSSSSSWSQGRCSWLCCSLLWYFEWIHCISEVLRHGFR